MKKKTGESKAAVFFTLVCDVNIFPLETFHWLLSLSPDSPGHCSLYYSE